MTKTNSKTSKPHLLRRVARQDRTFVALLLTLIFTCLWMVIDVFINTRASQIQTWYRFVAYGFEKVTLVFLVDVERFLVIFYLGNPKIKLKLTLAIIIKIIPKTKIKLATSR